MSIILCEAAHDENGQLGYETHKKGDQTKDEVRNYKYYNKPWQYVFRWKNDDMCNAFAIRMQQAVENPHIGYGQPARLDLFYELPKVGYDPSLITKDVDCDCSALVNAMVYYTLLSQGIRTTITGHETTAMMPASYKGASQWFEDVTAQIKLTNGKGLKKGDILVRAASHTASVWVGYSEDKTEVRTGTVTTPLYLRKKPISGQTMCVMTKGATITILDDVIASNGKLWYKARYGTYTGYCSAAYIR